ncbi:hypothetical protein IW261DRAFT_1363865 [Armillaria novae-zelandiae]|uniref:RBR-type E3 ubiquitin transferase n=1 Tax=Armillaria novae-zelandiae TaxID=153914 RepID=A0AA39PAD0_9AGAR|nr:hypothetical protein IW261DRAFT_1363865 [Armillaria novae-zelandiae]
MDFHDHIPDILAGRFSFEEVTQFLDEQAQRHSHVPMSDEDVALRLFAEDARDNLLRFGQFGHAPLPEPLVEQLFHDWEPPRFRDRIREAAAPLPNRQRQRAVQNFNHPFGREIPGNVPFNPIPPWHEAPRRQSRPVIPTASSSRLGRNFGESIASICSVCLENIEGHVIAAPCGHVYDASCMEALISAATQDESLFPPRCCRDPIPIESVQSHIDATVLATFKEKSTEFSTPIRVYCSNPKCSRFLGPKNDGKSPSTPLTCSCTTITCNSCRGNITHGDVFSHSCSSDTLEQEVRALADKKKWATCPGCSNLVELSSGCNHMTCRCGTQFCYHCNAKWGACDCVGRTVLGGHGLIPVRGDAIGNWFIPFFAQPPGRLLPARAAPVMTGIAPLTRQNLDQMNLRNERLRSIDTLPMLTPLSPHPPVHRARRFSTVAESSGPDRHSNMSMAHPRADLGPIRVHVDRGMPNPTPTYTTAAGHWGPMSPGINHTSRSSNSESLLRPLPAENSPNHITTGPPRPPRPDSPTRPNWFQAPPPDRMQGAGTRSSPIILDDDGDAVMSTPPTIPPFLHNANISLPNFGGTDSFQHAIRREGELNMNVDENPFATNSRRPWEEPSLPGYPPSRQSRLTASSSTAATTGARTPFDRRPFLEPRTVVQPPNRPW